MEEKNLTCINCPMGCSLVVQMDGEQLISVSGNNCKFGDTYARKEITNPTRIVTSTVTVKDGEWKLIPVKTRKEFQREDFRVHEGIEDCTDNCADSYRRCHCGEHCGYGSRCCGGEGCGKKNLILWIAENDKCGKSSR